MRGTPKADNTGIWSKRESMLRKGKTCKKLLDGTMGNPQENSYTNKDSDLGSSETTRKASVEEKQKMKI